MPVPVLTVAEMRRWEQATWAAGVTADAVIGRVGQLVARRILALARRGDRVLVLAGRGHNGDDARRTVPHLVGCEVEQIDVSDPGVQLTRLGDALGRRPAWIVDGLFGIGLNRPLDAAWRRFIERVNESNIHVLAVDAPSGLNSDTGRPEGTAVRAAITLTLGAPKQGLLKPDAWSFVGRLEVEPDIGLVSCPATGPLFWTLSDDFQGFPPGRQAATHKGSFGHLLIVAGSVGYHGAAVLAGRGAAAARPGLITVLTTAEAYLPVAAQLSGAMVRPWDDSFAPDARVSAILFGPGLAATSLPEAIRKQCVAWWRESPLPVIADASALDWLRGESGRASPVLRVITPHPGEAARLLQSDVATVQADRPESVRRLARLAGGSFVVLKGHQTCVGDSGGEIYVNGTGSPRLAQGGTGDVLAGYLGGLLAQPALQRDPLRTIRFAVWRHGQAGESAGWAGLVEDLPREMALGDRDRRTYGNGER